MVFRLDAGVVQDLVELGIFAEDGLVSNRYLEEVLDAGVATDLRRLQHGAHEPQPRARLVAGQRDQELLVQLVLLRIFLHERGVQDEVCEEGLFALDLLGEARLHRTGSCT